MRHDETMREWWERKLIANRLRCCANNIGIIPGVIPGNLLVTGNLTVNGGQLKVKSNTYYHRLGQLSGGQDGYSINLATDTTGQDDATLAGWSQTFTPSATQGRCGG